MATVLVTGASGDLGRHVVRHLLIAGHATRRLVHRSRPAQAGVEDRSGDLRTGAGLEGAFEGIDAVIHCATAPFRPRGVDVDGTGRLVRALESAAPSAFRRGRHILPEPRYGRQTWEEFLGLPQER